MRSSQIALLLLALSLAACEPAGTISGPARIVDGDTLEIAPVTIRLFGVDAFEGRQACMRNGGAWRCGDAATRKLEELVGGEAIICTERDTDRYGRTVARCTNGPVDLGAELVRAGLALAYREYSNDYVDEEEEAEAARRGAWAGSFEAPWDWRRGGSDDSAESSAAPARTPASAENSASCRIKGNLSWQGERIYHLPGSSSYEETIIDPARGERWFCSAAEAERAGWRASRAP